MRSFILYGTLALAGCAAPEQAFPDLATVKQPESPKATKLELTALEAKIKAEGNTTREAGRMVQAGEELTQPLPPAPVR